LSGRIASGCPGTWTADRPTWVWSG
jgi:hypothetical protein